ncbi:hypothetical protein QR685DRAFT_569892 [Neurospora intermedia]|uniref:Uncharacterized protein n=1 Tax=Neurospora intermedia TaxID=5142 RepID=A0ABR3DML9_NEUIN
MRTHRTDLRSTPEADRTTKTSSRCSSVATTGFYRLRSAITSGLACWIIPSYLDKGHNDTGVTAGLVEAPGLLCAGRRGDRWIRCLESKTQLGPIDGCVTI